MGFDEEKYRRDVERYEEAQRDHSYQKQLNRMYDLMAQIREKYAVLNNLGLLQTASADQLIVDCEKLAHIETKIREKREYYEQSQIAQSVGYKTLAMIYEKQQQYEHGAVICAKAIEAGFTEDATKGGLRGRLSKLIKKGNLRLTDEFAKVLML